MNYSNDRAFARAQAEYDAQVPDDEPDTTCEECEGEGTLLSPPDDDGELHEYECPICKGHGNMDAIRADNEAEAQIAKYESMRDDSEGHDL